MAARSSGGDSEGRLLVITRIFNAPVSVVFKLWTEPDHLMHWWGPKGFTTLLCEMDVRPGGAWYRYLRSPEGTEVHKRGVYREIAEEAKLVFTYATDDPDGNPGRETIVTVDFSDLGDKTRVTLRQAIFESSVACVEHERGWIGCLERFGEYLAGNPNVQSANV